MHHGVLSNNGNVQQEKQCYSMRNDLESIKCHTQCDNQHQLNKVREDIGNLTEICTNTINTVIDLSNELQILKAQFAEFKLMHTKKPTRNSSSKKFFQNSECYVNDIDHSAHSNKKKKKRKDKNKNQHSSNGNKTEGGQAFSKNFDDRMVYSNKGLSESRKNNQFATKERHKNDNLKEIEEEYESFDPHIPVKLANHKTNAAGTSNNSTCDKIKSEPGKNGLSKEAFRLSQQVADLKQMNAKLPNNNQFCPSDAFFKSSWPRNFHEVRDMMNFELLYKGNSNVKQGKNPANTIPKYDLSGKTDINDTKCLQRLMVQSKQKLRAKNEVRNGTKHKTVEHNLSEQSESTTVSKQSSHENSFTRSETKEAYSSEKSSDYDTLVTIDSKDSSCLSETESSDS